MPPSERHNALQPKMDFGQSLQAPFFDLSNRMENEREREKQIQLLEIVTILKEKSGNVS